MTCWGRLVHWRWKWNITSRRSIVPLILYEIIQKQVRIVNWGPLVFARIESLVNWLISSSCGKTESSCTCFCSLSAYNVVGDHVILFANLSKLVHCLAWVKIKFWFAFAFIRFSLLVKTKDIFYDSVDGDISCKLGCFFICVLDLLLAGSNECIAFKTSLLQG